MARRKKILSVLLLLIVLLLFFLPSIIKSYIINNSKELTGRQLQIGKLKYNYFTSTVKIYDFKLLEQNEKDVFTSFDTLLINLEPYKLISNTKALEQFYLKGLMVKAIMKDSTFNFDDLIAYHSTPEDSLNTEAEETFKYMLSNLELKDANFLFVNKEIWDYFMDVYGGGPCLYSSRQDLYALQPVPTRTTTTTTTTTTAQLPVPAPKEPTS